MPKSPKDASPASAVAPATIPYTLDPDPADDWFHIDYTDERLPRGLHLGDGLFRGRLLPDGRLLVLDLPPATQDLFYPDLAAPPAAPADAPLPPPTIATEV